MKQKPRSTYDTETTRELLGLESAQDVYNLTRPGALLHGARIRAGSFDQWRVHTARKTLIRYRLAAKLGRISPRYIDHSHDRACATCQGIAVEWEGWVLCENGHKTEESWEERKEAVEQIKGEPTTEEEEVA
jgi:hypothetical protein